MVCPPADELAPVAALKGLGNVTAMGYVRIRLWHSYLTGIPYRCLFPDSPMLNPPTPGFGPESDISKMPIDMYETCDVESEWL